MSPPDLHRQAGPPEDRPRKGLRTVVSAAPPAVLTPSDLAGIAGPADLIELRLDLLPDGIPIEAWLAAAPRPVLVTVRSQAQGGLFRGTPTEVARLLRAAAEAGAAWLDVEEAVVPHLTDLPAGVALLASVHGAPDVSAAWALADPCFDRIKIARPCDRGVAFQDLLEEARAAEARCFFVPYGLLGATRSIFAHERAFLFGAAAADAPAAPGQPVLTILLNELRAGEVTSEAALFGLVGTPPARSPSPAIHNACFRAAGRNALYVALDGLSLHDAVGLPFEGFSVTMPEKAAAYRFADEHDEDARATGVVNTLVRAGEGWSGHNTDVEAVREAAGAPPSERDAAFVYGAGAYARAAVCALKQGGWSVRVGARHERAALDLADVFDVGFAGSAVYERRAEDGLVINATPAGADGEPVAAFADADLGGLRVFDAPYAEVGCDTGLVTQARAQGAVEIIAGRALLAAQALAQARLFAVVADPAGGPGGGHEEAAAARALRGACADLPSLVLVGARGAGKTTVGRRLAQALGRPFVDLDAEVTRATGRLPAEWIEQEGWDAFREVECALLERALARTGLVLATGAGVVEHAASRALLTAARVVFLDVGPEEAAARVLRDPTPRPRLPGASDALDEARKAAASRGALWRGVANHAIDAHGTVDDVVVRLLALTDSAPT